MAHDDPHDPHHHGPPGGQRPAAGHGHATEGGHAAGGRHTHEGGRPAAEGSHGHEGGRPAATVDARVPREHKARAPAYARVFVVTCSDTRTEETDAGGRFIRERLADLGHVHAGSAIVRDDPALITESLTKARAAGAQVVLLTGGTGLSSRDSTFEAVSALLRRPLPGFGELFRALSFAEIGSAAMLSRAVAGVTAEGLVVFAMPGSPGAVRLACERLVFPELTHLLEELRAVKQAAKPAAKPAWKRRALLLPALEELLSATDAPARVRGDPVELPHRYRDGPDIEVAALLSAALAYGRVDLFKPRLAALLDALGPSPAATARDSSPRELLRRTGGFRYRMTDGRDVACLLYGAGAILRADGTLGARFGIHYRKLQTLRGALGAFVTDLCAPDFTPITGQREPTRRLKHLVPHPDRGSACKRLNLFLRWMVRGPDGVDFGLWRDHVPAGALVIPLDTHVHRIGRFIGLTRRQDLSWLTAEDVTRRLRDLDAADPVRFDFALSHLGISGGCPSRRDAVKCAGCPLRPICRHWT